MQECDQGVGCCDRSFTKSITAQENCNIEQNISDEVWRSLLLVVLAIVLPTVLSQLFGFIVTVIWQKARPPNKFDRDLLLH